MKPVPTLPAYRSPPPPSGHGHQQRAETAFAAGRRRASSRPRPPRRPEVLDLDPAPGPFAGQVVGVGPLGDDALPLAVDAALQGLVDRAGELVGHVAHLAGQRQRLQQPAPVVIPLAQQRHPVQVQHVEEPELHRHGLPAPGRRPAPRPGSSAAAAARSWCAPWYPGRRSRRRAPRCGPSSSSTSSCNFGVGVGEVVAGAAVQGQTRGSDGGDRADAVPFPLEPPLFTVGDVRRCCRRWPASVADRLAARAALSTAGGCRRSGGSPAALVSESDDGYFFGPGHFRSLVLHPVQQPGAVLGADQRVPAAAPSAR